MSLIETIETLGNTTPSLSLIVSLIVGSAIIVTSTLCTAYRKQSTTNEPPINCKTLLYTGLSIIVSGIVLFYFAQDYNFALYEGLSIISSTVISGLIIYLMNR